jgi:hypothetical protein
MISGRRMKWSSKTSNSSTHMYLLIIARTLSDKIWQNGLTLPKTKHGHAQSHNRLHPSWFIHNQESKSRTKHSRHMHTQFRSWEKMQIVRSSTCANCKHELLFIPYSLKKKHPEVFAQALIKQNKKIADTFMIVVVGINNALENTLKEDCAWVHWTLRHQQDGPKWQMK